MEKDCRIIVGSAHIDSAYCPIILQSYLLALTSKNSSMTR